MKKSLLISTSLLKITILLSLALDLLLLPVGIPVTGTQTTSDQGKPANILPNLATFTLQVENGIANQVTGIYASGVFAFPVVQQPGGNASYVAATPDTITQFSMAARFGSLGFLAHNNLAGRLFSQLHVGSIFSIVYGDGHSDSYIIFKVRHFQALSPMDPYSDFKDLEAGTTLSASTLFYQTYGVSGQVVLQTCIANNGMDSWGRLFVIATKYNPAQVNIPARLHNHIFAAASLGIYSTLL